MEEQLQKLVNTRLDELARNKKGQLTAEDVITDARDKNSVLNQCFEWDEKKAAHSHWVSVANRLINGWKYTITVETVNIQIPKMLRTPGKVSVFSPIGDIRKTRDDQGKAMKSELDRVKSALERARGVATGLELNKTNKHINRALIEIDKALAEIEKVIAEEKLLVANTE